MGWWSEHVVPRVVDAALSRADLDETRRRTCRGLRGQVLELGFGGGLNLAFLPDDVTGIGAVEPSDLGWRLSERRRAGSDVPVARIRLEGGSIAAADASYDAALCTFTLCTVPDAVAALREVRRVVRPGGDVHFLEHGVSDDPRTRAWQRRLDPFQQRLVGGCHLTRDPAALVEQAGMRIRTLEVGPLAGLRGPGVATYGYRGTATV